VTASDLVAAVDRLGMAFAARDVATALDCFVPDADITYVGSEAGEWADGRAAVAALFGSLFARPVAYTWRAREVSAHRHGRHLYLVAEADAAAQGDTGEREEFGYRLSGLLELAGDGWRWRACQGSEPTH
jgi:uncharacterized protein (TIGR02246 family)